MRAMMRDAMFFLPSRLSLRSRYAAILLPHATCLRRRRVFAFSLPLRRRRRHFATRLRYAMMLLPAMLMP